MIIRCNLVDGVRRMFKHGRQRARLRGGCRNCRGRGRGGGGILYIWSVRCIEREKGYR